MPPDSYSQNSNQTKPRKLILIAVGLLAAIAIIALIIHLSQAESQQSKYLKSATAAARIETPNAKVSGVKVAGGFAVAIVSDPTAAGQANAGNQTYFKVNKDGSMTQIAKGSSFSPVGLLGLGIPLASQAELSGHKLTQVQQALAAVCGYSSGNTPGYLGFDGSFNPGGWQIDAGTLDGLEQALTAVIGNQNAGAKTGQKVICVNATRDKSNAATDKQTYVSTFTLMLQFITSDGTVTSHTFSFALGPHYSRSYTLDGQQISAS